MLFPRDFWRFASMCLFVFIWAGMSTKDLLFALWIGLCSYLIASSKAESAWYKLTTESCNVMTVCTYVFMLNTNLRHINEHQTLIEAVRDAHAINGCFYYFYWTQCLKQEILITFFGYMYLFKGDFHKNMSESNFVPQNLNLDAFWKKKCTVMRINYCNASGCFYFDLMLLIVFWFLKYPIIQ